MMECISPILSNTTKYGRVFLPCGKCIPCIQRKGRDWFVRLSQEVKYSPGYSYFITLTYNDVNIPMSFSEDNPNEPYLDFDKEYIQRFIKRIRKELKGKFKYFLTAERGELHGRPHYHAIFIGIPLNADNFEDLLIKHWVNKKNEPIGFVDLKGVNQNRLCYVTDYMLCKSEPNQFRLMSKGIGLNYVKPILTRYHHKTLDGFLRVEGVNYPMPRYLRGKIHTKMENQIIGKKLSEKAMEGIDTRDDRYKVLIGKVKFKKQKRLLNSNKKYLKMKKNEKQAI